MNREIKGLYYNYLLSNVENCSDYIVECLLLSTEKNSIKRKYQTREDMLSLKYNIKLFFKQTINNFIKNIGYRNE